MHVRNVGFIEVRKLQNSKMQLSPMSGCPTKLRENLSDCLKIMSTLTHTNMAMLQHKPSFCHNGTKTANAEREIKQLQLIAFCKVMTHQRITSPLTSRSVLNSICDCSSCNETLPLHQLTINKLLVIETVHLTQYLAYFKSVQKTKAWARG